MRFLRSALCSYQADRRAYEDYDIAIWSQTHWSWLEAKLFELGMLGSHQNYKVSFFKLPSDVRYALSQIDHRCFQSLQRKMGRSTNMSEYLCLLAPS